MPVFRNSRCYSIQFKLYFIIILYYQHKNKSQIYKNIAKFVVIKKLFCNNLIILKLQYRFFHYLDTELTTSF